MFLHIYKCLTLPINCKPLPCPAANLISTGKKKALTASRKHCNANWNLAYIGNVVDILLQKE